MPKKIDPIQAMDCLRRFAAGAKLNRTETLTAVRFSLADFADRHPGRSVEIRIPWAGAVQAIAGPEHTRGTPPNVVEMDADTWLSLAVGKPVDTRRISHSGIRADLSPYLPLYGPAMLG